LTVRGVLRGASITVLPRSKIAEGELERAGRPNTGAGLHITNLVRLLIRLPRVSLLGRHGQNSSRNSASMFKIKGMDIT
jgi:hypothetical protein